ncbi:MAG: CsbD family protein [Geminicoccaceae bacterium]|nr:CsbD family protein [Geminicoccaceae bacterium]
MNENRIVGAAKQVKGTIKEAVGKVAGNPDLEAEGKADKLEGKLQNAAGKVEDAIDGAQKAVRRSREES